jgi:hypothetical protein
MSFTPKAPFWGMVARGVIVKWKAPTKQVDFALAYTQAPIEFDMYIKSPREYTWQMEIGIIMYSSC